MIEVHLAYDIKPGIDEQVYFEWLKKEILKVLKAQKIVEIRANRNIKGNPEVLVVALWENLEDWTEFSQSEAWRSLTNTLQQSFAANIRIEVWGPSPFLPTTLRPHK
ncbi:MAG TPA: hypothetical protein PKZ12_02265 [Smithellaceae bacterium]|nr:hypothetical protein [Smithellaceae bacterium]